MNNITTFDTSVFEVVNGQINLTKICQHFQKNIKDWTRNKTTKQFLEAFSSNKGDGQIILSVKGGDGEQGSWTSYREVALKLAQWISPEFEVFCIQKLDELFQKGKTSLLEPKTTLTYLKEAVAEIERLESKLQATTQTLEHKQSIIVDMAEKVPAKTMRATINEVVKNYASSNHIVYNYCWNKLYKEFKYIYNIDLETRSKHSGKSKIDEAEKAGKLEELYLLALKMYEVSRKFVADL